MSPNLHYCRSNYSQSPIQDINPLLLQKYKKILVLCAREGQITRINKRMNSSTCLESIIEIDHFGWWEAKDRDLLNKTHTINYSLLDQYEAIIILDKNRIHESFNQLLKAVESYATQPPSK